MKYLLLEDCNFIDYPIGGQLTFAKQLISQFREEIILVGNTTNSNIPIGEWTSININGIEHKYLPIKFCSKKIKKPLLPARITWTFALLKYKNKIKEITPDIIITQNINSLYPALKYDYKVLHISAGLNNPFDNLRYKGFKFLKYIFQLFWEKQLSKVDYFLAAADTYTINSLKNKSIFLKNKKIISFPTRFDDNIFQIKDRYSLRKLYNYENDTIIVSFSGRINNVKGWDFLLDCFKLFSCKISNSIFLFIGDGEEREILLEYANRIGIKDKIIIKGFVEPNTVSDFLNLSDLVVLGSHKEGWCTSIVEALACGRNVVSTEVSSIKEMITDGVNGYVVERDLNKFCERMIDSLALPRINTASIEAVSSYKVSKLKKEIEDICG